MSDDSNLAVVDVTTVTMASQFILIDSCYNVAFLFVILLSTHFASFKDNV